MASFAKPHTFDPTHPGRHTTGGGIVDRKKLMKDELGLEGEDLGDDHGSEEEHSDGDAAGGATASFARSAGGGGGTFGSAKGRSVPDAQATSYSASAGGGVPVAVYRAVQDEKIALGETVRELQEKVLHHGATNKQTIAMLRKALQARLQATLAELAGGVEEIENKLRGPGATGGGHVSQKIQDAIAVQRREIDAATSALVGSDGSADAADRISALPPAALQAELLATLGQVSSLRTSASAQAAEVSRWRDLKLEASTLLEALRQGKGRLTAEQIDLVSDSLDRAAAAAAAAGSGGGPDAGVTAGGSSSSDAAVAALRSQLVAEKGRSEALRAQLAALSKAAEKGTAGAEEGGAREAALSSQVSALKRQLSEANMTALSAQQSGAQGASAEAKGLRAELDHVRRAADIAAVELAGARSELEASRSSLAAREDRIRTLEANAGRVEGAQAASAATAEAVAAGESRIAELSARVSDLGGQLAKAQEESRVQRSMVRRLEEQMETHMEQAAAAVRSVEGQQAADAQAALQRIARLDSLIAESRAHVARLEADVAAEKAEKEKAVAEERAQAAKRVDEATSKAKEKQESIKASAQKQFAELKDRFMQDLEVANKQHADAMAVQAERIAEMSRAQAHLGANMADARRKAQDVHAAGDSLRKALKAQLADFGGVLAGTSSQLVSRIASFGGAIGTMRERYKKEMAERRRLHNLVQELRGNIRVYCRARPPLPFEEASLAASFPAEGEIQVSNTKKQVKSWTFDQVFVPGTSNADVYKETEPLITSVMDGYNVCIFAYGQTGSGKTFTMEGSESQPGVNYRALGSLFEFQEERRDSWRYELGVSMIEIYNESIGDMLGAGRGSAHEAKLVVREGPTGNYIPDLVIKPVENVAQVIAIMRQGYRNRTTFATNMNEHSSRSHCMLSVYVSGTNRVTGQLARGKLHLVDLAGSERVGRSGATGDRLKEAQAINKSLSALGDVIAARAEKRAHVPFRNSTLTWVLADCLSGDSKTLMFVNLSPVVANAEESFCSLNFAARVGSVELGRASKNVTPAAKGGAGGSSASASSARRGSTFAPDSSPGGDDDYITGTGDDDDGDGDAVGDDSPAAGRTPGGGVPRAPPPTAGAGRPSIGRRMVGGK